MLLKLKQKKTFIFIVLLLLSSGVIADTKIQTVKDLKLLKEQLELNNLPVLLLFTAQDCDYCEAIRKNHLLPMVESGDYASKMLFRQLYIEDFSYLRNEKGELISGDTVALKYDVEVTPTILFVDSKGQELSERIVGINNLDYFDKLLSTSISNAISRVSKVKN